MSVSRAVSYSLTRAPSSKKCGVFTLIKIDCHLLAVHPDHQRKGVGALLMQWGLDIGEKTNLPVYTESSPQAYGLYKKLGFQTLKEKIVHKPEVTGEDSDAEVPLVVKMPSAAGDLVFEDWVAKGYPPDYK